MEFLTNLILLSYLSIQILGLVLGNPLLLKREELAVSFDYQGGEKEFVVKTGSTVKIELKTNPSTGYSWEFVNEQEIKNSGAVELTEDTYKSSCQQDGPVMVAGCGGVRTLRYRINDATKTLPKIDLVYKRSWEEETVGEVIVTLTSGEKTSTKTKTKTTTTTTITTTTTTTPSMTTSSKSDSPDPTTTPTTETISINFDYDGGKKEVVVHTGTVIEIKVPNNSSAGDQWSLVNEEEIKASNAIDYQHYIYKSNCDPLNAGCGGFRIYPFTIRDATQPLPKLHLQYKTVVSDDVKGEVIVTLKSDESSTSSSTPTLSNPKHFFITGVLTLLLSILFLL